MAKIKNMAKSIDLKKDNAVSPGMVVWRRFKRNKIAMISLYIFIILVIITALAPVLATHDRDRTSLRMKEMPPSSDNWLGTSTLGRDIYTRVLYGGRVSMLVGLGATAIQLFIGVILGSIAGYYGKFFDTIIMRIADVVLSLPFLIIAVIMASILGAGMFNTMIVIGVLAWPGTCRIIRGQFLSIKQTEYMEAARALGLKQLQIIRKHMLPNTMAPLIINATLAMAAAILIEAALSYLGLGVPPPTPSWGNMLESARNMRNIQHYPWMWVPPGTMIILSVLTINLIGDGLRDAFDPRLKR